jgi:DNA-binding GntR family transcriptional regulator
VVQIQANAIEAHRAIVEALEAGDPEGARVAMDNHMSQTLNDLRAYVLQVQ